MLSSSHEKKNMKISFWELIPTAVDRISDLPDSILCNILHSLPTKFVATTTVLSKRWKQLLLSLLALDFDSRGFKTSDDFHRVIYTILDRRDITLPIHSFRVKYRRLSCEQRDVNQFVYHVLKRGIQNLCLNLPCETTNILPIIILSCRTLMVLKLTNILMGDISHKEDLHLPSLKTLHLNSVEFESYRDLVNLLLCCPLLEDLRTTGCSAWKYLEYRFKDDFITVLPNLIKARIAEMHIPLCMVSKAQTLRVQGLYMLTCCTKLPMFYNLTHLELNLQTKLWFPKWTWLLGMLKLSPKLQNIIIQDNDILEELDDKCWKDSPIVPECLLSHLKTCHIRDYKDKKYDHEFAKYIIENSKVLDTMAINSTCYLDTNTKAKYQLKSSSCTRGSATCKLLFD